MKDLVVGKVLKTNQGCLCEVVELLPKNRVRIVFLDRHRHTRVVYKTHLRNGRARNPYHPSVHSIGYTGVGKHSVRDAEGRLTAAYSKWSNMLRRCYDTKFHTTKPTYKGCTVHPTWHNFQVFAEWYYEQACSLEQDAELDKDILHPENKLYSPETCLVVTHRINTLMCVRPRREGMPQGVHWDSQRLKFGASCHNINGRQVALGRYTCKWEAFDRFKSFKQSVILELAELERNRIGEKVYQALINYEVEP